jgi:hypothetical protein
MFDKSDGTTLHGTDKVLSRRGLGVLGASLQILILEGIKNIPS